MRSKSHQHTTSAGVAACGVELVQVLARAQQVPLRAATVAIRAVLDPSKRVRPEVSLFNAVRLHFHPEKRYRAGARHPAHRGF